MIKNKHRISVFYEYILSYVSILIIAVLLGITLIQNASSRIETEYEEQQIHKAESLRSQIDNMTEGLLKSDYLLAMDDTRRQVILDPSPYNEYMLIRELKQMKPSDLSGEDLFLCSVDGNYVYDVNGKSNKELYWRSQLGMDGGEDVLTSWVELNTSTFFPCVNDEGNAQLLFVYPLKYVTWYAADRQAFIVVYFSPKSLSHLANSFKGEMKDDFILFFGDTPILSTLEYPNTDALKDFASTVDKYGASSKIIDERFCVALEPEFPGLRLVLIAGNNEILTFKTEYLNRLLVIMLPFLLFGIILVILYVHRHYKSVKQLTDRFTTELNRKGNEFERIGEEIDRIHQKDTELIERIGTMDSELKRLLLESVINGIRAEKEELTKAGVDLDDGVRSVLCVKGVDEQSTRDLLQEYESLSDSGVKAVWTEKYAALALIAPAADEAKTLAIKMKELGAVSVGISYFADGADGIHRAFLQALNACGEVTMKGGGVSVYNSDSVSSIDETLVNRYMFLQKAIQVGNAPLAEEILNNIRTQVEQLAYVEAKCEHFVLINILRHCADELKTTLSQDELYQALTSERSDVFFDCVLKLLAVLTNEAERQHEEMELSAQNDLINYIEDHFADYDINTEDLCIHFRLSSNNLSHIVKERTGHTPREYIIKLRMEEARRLLMETDEPVNNISQKVGYAGASHFIKTYKQYFGLTPAQMRKG